MPRLPAVRDALRRCRWPLPDLLRRQPALPDRTHEARGHGRAVPFDDPNRVHLHAPELCVLGWAVVWASEEEGV
jgi:hypothetical protein